MVRVLFETSVPASTLEGVRREIETAATKGGLSARLETVARGGCAGPASGGDAAWTPCWVSIEAETPGPARFEEVLQEVKDAVVGACRAGGLEVFALPANAQIGEEFCRLRDLLDAARRLK